MYGTSTIDVSMRDPADQGDPRGTLDQSWSSSGAHEAESPVDVVQSAGGFIASSFSAAAWLWMLPGGQDPIDGGSDLLAGDRTRRAGHQ
jgi:hypothetical protein